MIKEFFLIYLGQIILLRQIKAIICDTPHCVDISLSYILRESKLPFHTMCAFNANHVFGLALYISNNEDLNLFSRPNFFFMQ